MADIELNLSGDDLLKDELEDIRDKGTSNLEAEVRSTADYSQYLEFGEEMPPYPFFRPAIREAKLDFDVFLRTTMGVDVDTAQNVDQLIWWIAKGLETQMKRNVTAAGSLKRSPGTKPDHPKVQTGNLRRGIEAERL